MQQDNNCKQRDQQNDIKVSNHSQNTDLKDTISDIQWQPSKTSSNNYTNNNQNNSQNMYILGAATWNGEIRIYTFDPRNKALNLQTMKQLSDPVLSISFDSDNSLYFGLANGQIGVFDFVKSIINIIGNHDTPILKIILDHKNNFLLTFSYDGICKLFNLQNYQFKQFNLKYRPLSIDYQEQQIGIAFEQEKLLITTVQQMFQINTIQQNDYQNSTTSSSSSNNDNNNEIRSTISTLSLSQNFLFVGTQEGRGNVSSYFKGTPYTFKQVITFKVMSEDINSNYNSVDKLYSGVTHSQFHPQYGEILFTAGSNGKIIIWNINKKKFTQTYIYANQPISAMKLNQDGNFYAYALGYDWHQGIEGVDKFDKPQLYIHQIDKKNDLDK